jgi:hypothetical protein
MCEVSESSFAFEFFTDDGANVDAGFNQSCHRRFCIKLN